MIYQILAFVNVMLKDNDEHDESKSTGQKV